jgi:hypothetical protein
MVREGSKGQIWDGQAVIGFTSSVIDAPVTAGLLRPFRGDRVLAKETLRTRPLDQRV